MKKSGVPMSVFRSGLASTLLCLFLAIHFINNSMDAIDQKPLHANDDLAVNEIESLVELVLEDIMEWENCIPETEEDDTNRESEGGTNGLSLFALVDETVGKNSQWQISSSKMFFNLTPSIISTFRSVCSPPPET